MCTCVHIYLPLFVGQAVMTQWEMYALEHKKHGYKVRVPADDKLLTTVELKLDQKDQLQEIYRHPGENDVSQWGSGLGIHCILSLLFVCVRRVFGGEGV